MNNKKGFSLVELAIGLAVITVLVLAISVSAGIRDNARVQSAVDSVHALRSAAENYLSTGSLDYSNITIAVLQTANLLPANFNPTKSNPWGGDFSIGPNTADNTHFDIALTGLNQTQATKLTRYFNNSASSSTYDAIKTTWTVTF
ncbi:MAG: type II secretion system protein [Candidatus Omnitrophica bacterium]|nr:type II secretion system protein [Candidatus Omnitrophota bacterium]